MAGSPTFFDQLMSFFRGPGQGSVQVRSSPQGAGSNDKSPLETELTTYQAHHRELLAHVGAWVLIHGDQILGIRPTYEEALQLGYEHVGYANFLVHQIAETDSIHSLPPQPV